MKLHLISRDVAKSRNLPKFFTGKRCKRGLVAERRTSTGACLCICCASLQKYASGRWGKENRAEYEKNARLKFKSVWE